MRKYFVYDVYFEGEKYKAEFVFDFKDEGGTPWYELRLRRPKHSYIMSVMSCPLKDSFADFQDMMLSYLYERDNCGLTFFDTYEKECEWLEEAVEKDLEENYL